MDNSIDLTNSSHITFENLGWDEDWNFLFSSFKGPYIPGRVVTAHKTRYDVITPEGIISLPISGAMKTKKMIPIVGDFVVVLSDPDSGTKMIVSILERRTTISRGGSGEHTGEQVIAANIDTVFIITDPGHDFSIPRLLRYMLIVRASGAHPVILLNKADTCDDISPFIDKIHREIGDVPVFPVSALQSSGLDVLKPYLGSQKTVIFLGSSGVGKSTLMNALTGTSVQKTGEIREDDGKGRHTTTVRHLTTLPSGCSIVDTPGMRELRVWTAGEHLSEEFSDIESIAAGCKFSDCTHQNEPGCAVIQAITEGTLMPGRLEQYLKIQKEIAFEKDKANIGLKRMEKEKWQGICELGKNYREKKRWIQNR
ncbi:MAG: ribosome small subunit-dependent GTPase A [Methanomicrobiales archaeon]|nr:ribosome small subunit-dependent GTPase A [Methanomicrobiales archaeon]